MAEPAISVSDLTVRRGASEVLHGISLAVATGSVTGQLGLGGYERRSVAALSGGQRSRVSLAVALLGRPKVLILDEPTVGLDPVLRAELWQLFHALAANGSTLLVSSHVMDEAAECDRLVLMRDGRILTQRTPDGLRLRRRTPLTVPPDTEIRP